MTNESPWWTRDRHEDRRSFLAVRGRLKSALRAYFEEEDFIEVETGCLQVSPGNETHLHAFETQTINPDLSARPFYLHTSPEFACKKLLSAGEQAIFTFAPCFRNRERGPLHANEFTMLEWYRAGGDYRHLIADCENVLLIAAAVAGRRKWEYAGRRCDAGVKLHRVSVAAAFKQYFGLDLDCLLVSDDKGERRMREAALARGHKVASDESWSVLFSRLISEIEPEFGRKYPMALTEYPRCEAALARVSTNNPSFAERFEVYCCGVELANGFNELTDANEQRRRFEAEMAEKERIYGERYPIDEDFLAALDAMPDAAGCALGFDRLVMLATGAQHIDQVIWTPMPPAT